jgi:predicted nucleic acid-binding protein
MRLKHPAVLDTDVASLLWRGKLGPEQHQKLVGRTVALTFVTVAEFLRGAYKANWDRDQQQMARLTAFYEKFDLIRCDFDIVKTWGKLSGLALQAGITVPANDCWVAACCVSHDYPLLTRNDKHFKVLEQYGLRLL